MESLWGGVETDYTVFYKIVSIAAIASIIGAKIFLFYLEIIYIELFEQKSNNFLIQVGDHVSGGDIVGTVRENDLVTHRIMLPPKAMGVLRWVAPAGKYTVKDTVAKVEFNGTTHEYPMMQVWPVRSPRPVIEKLAADYPLLTGQRVLDALFP